MSGPSFQQRLTLAIESISGWAMSDSCVEVDPTQLRRALQFDSMSGGRLPTEEECKAIVCGDDEGEIPLNLQLASPKTHALLEEYW